MHKVKPASHLAILYADRRKPPGVPGAAIAIFASQISAIKFAGILQVCLFYAHRCESSVKSTNQVGRFYYMTFQNAPRLSPGTRLKYHIVAIDKSLK